MPLHVIVKLLNRVACCFRQDLKMVLVLCEGFTPADLNLYGLSSSCGGYSWLLKQGCGMRQHEPLTP